jgi:hypothetical protein
MFIPILIIALITFLASLVASLVGIIGYVVLKFMKEELNLKIKIDSDEKDQ